MDDDEIILTKEGHDRLQKELLRLLSVDRPEASARVREAKRPTEDFDTSEYENAKMDQAVIEGRILELKSILRRSTVLDEDDIPTRQVGLGSRVRVRDQDSQEAWELQLVAPIEADPSEDRISYESPVGQALMGRKLRELVEVNAPAGKIRYRITRIWK